MQAYSMDLRERALLDSDAGMKAADVAVKYRVSGSWVRLLKQRRRETGEIAPRVQRHGRRRMLEPHLHTLAALIAEQPDRTLAELKDGLTGTFYTSGNEREPLERKESDMTKKRHTPEQIVTLLRQVEVAVANGKGTPQACKEAAITEQTYYRWRKEYGGLKLAQAKRLKELEKENSRLKHVVAELSLEKQILREVAQGNS